jgi:hypothetical protein
VSENAAFIFLERDGSVLATTGPVRSSDARLRRTQALAHHSGAALRIVRELISQKLAGQEQVARDKLLDPTTAETIGKFRAAVATAETLPAIAQLESQGAAAYWAAWATLPIIFPTNDLRVPDHWRSFGTRKSPLSGSPRRAANPPNAILNYLYAVLESEAVLASAALGLDPGMGFLHVDTAARNSLSCDLMEPVRPRVDAFLLDWITREPLRREWFFERRDGTCRLMGSFAIGLSETAPMWGRALAPLAEWVARTLWLNKRSAADQLGPPTRLTQNRKREVKGGSSMPLALSLPRPQKSCRGCGAPLKAGRSHCMKCAVPFATKRLVEAERAGRAAGQSAQAQARRANDTTGEYLPRLR